ncbi:MAG: extracellular solute-binding protein [Clostridia bacterium]|nr:extracellular solute-binding protein [Clostridia bacterium]
MKSFKIKVTSMLLVSVLLIGSLAGCGGGNKKAEEQKPQAQETKTDKPSGEAVEIKIPVYERGNQGQPPAENNYWTKWIAEKALKDINVKVTYVPIPRTTDIDKFNMLLAANQAPDVIFSFDYPVMTAFYGRGVLQEIPKDMLKSVAPNFVKFVGEETLKYGEVGGKQYYLTAKRPLSYTPYTAIIRQDWLDAVGMKNPTNTDEFIAVMKAFKEKDPGKLGAKNTIPMSYSLKAAKSQVQNYGFRPDPLPEEELAMYSDVQLGALTWAPEKERLKFLNQLYLEGLMSSEWALDKDNKKAEADFMSGKAGIFHFATGPMASNPPIAQTLVKNVPTAKLSVLDFGWQTKPGNKNTGRDYWPFGIMSGINKSCKNPEAVLKFFDWMSKPEILNVLQNGVEGKNYTLKDGVPVPVAGFKGEESLLNGTGKDIWCLVTEGKDTGDPVQNLKVETIQRAPAGFEYLWQQSFDQMSKQKRYPDFLFDKPVTSTTKYVKALDAKWEESLAKVIMAKKGEFDATYDKACKDYLAAGYQEILAEKKKLYDEMKAKK